MGSVEAFSGEARRGWCRVLAGLGLAAALLLGNGPAGAFCTIAGGCAPTGGGRLLVIHLGPDQEPADEAVSVYLSGLAPELENLMATGRTGTPIALVPGVYDMVVHTMPATWRREVAIERDRTTEVTTGGYGHLLVSGHDAAGEPVSKTVFVYTPENREDVAATGRTNEAFPIPAGPYYLHVALRPAVIFERVEIEEGETTRVRLPAWGRLLLSGDTAAGEPVDENFWVYAFGDRDDVIVSGDTNEPLGLPPGIYDIHADLDPDSVFEGVSIVAGETVEIALPPYGALLVSGIDAEGKPLYAKSVFLYAEGGEDILSSGRVNERLDLPAGTYDVDVDLKPDIWHRGTRIAPGETVEIDLPQWGELEVRLSDPAGSEVNRMVYLYRARGDSEAVSVFIDRSRLIPPGSYVVRLDPSGGFEDVWLAAPVGIEAGRTTVLDITIGEEAAGPAVPDIEPELSLDRTSFTPGETILARFAAPASFADDAWVGIVPAEVEHGDEARNDLHDLEYAYLGKQGSGELTFTAPTEPGAYDLRMHDTDLGGREVASVGFTVQAPARAAPGRLMVEVRDAAGAPLAGLAYELFAPGSYEEALRGGTANEAAEVPAGRYDLRLNAEPSESLWPYLDPYLWLDGIEVGPARTTELDLPQWGEVIVAGTGPGGARLSIDVRLFKPATDKPACLDYQYFVDPFLKFLNTEAKPVPPGTYVVWLDHYDSALGKGIEACLVNRIDIAPGATARLEASVDAAGDGVRLSVAGHELSVVE